MKPLRIGIAGLGTVAGGVVRLLRENAKALARQAGRPLSLIRVASRTKTPGVALGDAAFTTDLNALHQGDVDVVVELIGGEDRALQLVREALGRGQDVVTANKAIMARHGDELLGLAAQGTRCLRFEASVAGGVPVVNALARGLAGDQVHMIAGIVNGTCNYILTEMEQQGASFSSALDQAQTQGFAEADPTYDIEGIDTAHKLTILSALAFDMGFHFDEVYTEGVAGISQEDLEYAKQLGYRIKHLGLARRAPDGVEMRVHPTLVPEGSLLASVDGVMNAVWMECHAAGATLYYGAGAGSLPTASAVVADIVAIAQGDRRQYRTGGQPQSVLPMGRVSCAFYLKIPSRDAPGVFAEIATILGRHGISIESAIQKGEAVCTIDGNHSWVPIVILTAPVAEAAMASALTLVQGMPEVVGDITRIRVEPLAHA